MEELVGIFMMVRAEALRKGERIGMSKGRERDDEILWVLENISL